MLEGKAIIGETDMFQTMQQDALRLAAKALDVFDVIESTEIAHFIKKGGNALWGQIFGSFVTHCHGCFIYFCIGSLAILLFRGAVGPAAEANLFPASEAVKA
ncbi:hypothetical protein L1049_009585 [Liquidambar formosana]|uniref:Dynein light chain n=1 Tax=Liquidambar formosana TaxID=63359 RepID=A0AAP0R3I9_LIQFO